MSALSPQHLFLSDFDGTLVGLDLKISERVKKAVHAWQEAGNIFSIITGRTYSGVLEEACKELKITNIIAARGGAEIWDPVTNTIRSAVYIEEEDAQKIVEVLTKHQLYFEIGKEEGVYAPVNTFGYKDPWKKYFPLETVTYDKVTKIRTYLFPQQKKDIHELIHEEITLQLPEVHAIKADAVHFMSYDITSAKATKHIAALEMMQHFNISEKHTIGIGDGYNDYPLLSAAGRKIAMGNAPDELLQIATMVVPVVEEDGVAVAIESLLEDA